MSLTERGCPPIVQNVFERTHNFTRPESVKNVLSFQHRRGDMLLTTGVKCGSSWMQQIVHRRHSVGDMDFEEIDSVILLIQFVFEYKEDPHFTQPLAPPGFVRMHLPYEIAPKGFSKYIVVTRLVSFGSSCRRYDCCRHPTDAAISGFFFRQNWLFEEGEADINELVECSSSRTASPTLLLPMHISCVI